MDGTAAVRRQKNQHQAQADFAAAAEPPLTNIAPAQRQPGGDELKSHRRLQSDSGTASAFNQRTGKHAPSGGHVRFSPRYPAASAALPVPDPRLRGSAGGRFPPLISGGQSPLIKRARRVSARL